jgi:hypothetical protein
MKNLIVVVLLLTCGVAQAASLQYTTIEGHFTSSGGEDIGIGYEYCYQDSNVLPSGSTSGLAGNTSGNCGVDFGSASTGTISAIDEGGFDLQASTAFWMTTDPSGQGSFTSTGSAQINIDFTLSEATDLLFEVDWDSLAEVGEGAGSVVRLQLQDQDANQILFTLFNSNEVSGSNSHLEQLDAGNYRVSMFISSGGYADNSSSSVNGLMSVSVVPIPAAVWLFGSALGGLGWMRRRKTV